MSRIGKQPIDIPAGVTVEITPQEVKVTGSKGTLSQEQLPGIIVKQAESQILVTRIDDEAIHRAKHGLMRTLIDNMIQGVSKGFEKKLEVNGVGFRVNLAGQDLKLNLGFSHDVHFPLPQGIVAKVEQNQITISGINKQQVGQIAAEIRALKKPEPYKGKGIKYADERILRKSGKSGKDG